VATSAAWQCAAAAPAYAARALHWSAASRAQKGPRGLPTRGSRHDAEWDKLRTHRAPHITTVDPATKPPALPPNDLELDQLSFRYGLPPLPTLQERLQTYSVEQAYYERRDARIRDHLGRLLRMKALSKAEMLILIAQVEEANWNLDTMQRAYVPELHHAARDEQDDHIKSLQLGTGGVAVRAEYRKKKDEKRAARKEGKEVKPPKGDGESKYGYRRDLANIGPESWDYLSPYVILEPEARHLSYLDGAFRDEDRYIQWDVEARNLALAAKLQRMKQLGIPLHMANSMITPDNVQADHVFPRSNIRRALKRLHKAGKRPNEAWWKNFDARPNRRAANERLLRRKEAKTMTEARRNIPAYIQRFEQEQQATEINVGATTVLAQNLYLQQRIQAEAAKPSSLTAAQQASAKALLGVFAQRNRLAMKKMFLSTRTLWERLMIERAIERKYLEQYLTVGSDDFDSKYLLKMEQEMMQMMQEIAERFENIDWTLSSLKLRDYKLAQQQQQVEYAGRYMKKMEELMEQHGELPDQPNAGERNWTRDILEWEEDPANDPVEQEKKAALQAEKEHIDNELDNWNEWYDVQVADELGRMLDCGEVKDEASITLGTLQLAEMRVGKRLNANRDEWKEWKHRPQNVTKDNMEAIPDVTRASEDASTLGGAEKSQGQQIIAQILARDPLVAASKKWRERMAPRFADVDRYANEERPGQTQMIDAQGNLISSTQGVGAGGVGGAGGAPGSAPVVDSVHGDGSVLPDFNPELSTAGHQLMDPRDVSQRRAMYQHAMSSKEILDDYIRAEAEDPMLALLNEHSSVSGRKKSSAGEDDGSNPNAFSTVDPKLGFEDDDFRLYDPVLTKVSKEQQGGGGEEEGGQTTKKNNEDEDDADKTYSESATEEYQDLKRKGEDYLANNETDPAMWAKWQDRAFRRANFLDLDPFGPANTDERRAFDDNYFFLDEEEYAYRKRVDPSTDHQKPLTALTYVEPYDEQPTVMRFDLSEETQSVLYMLHRSDPVKYTPRALAHKFQLSAKRVKSTLLMQAIHYRMMENGVIHPLMHNYTEERALDDLLHPSMPMIHDPPQFQIQRLPDYRWVREDDMHRVLAEERAIEERFLSRSARLDLAEQRYYEKYGYLGRDVPDAAPAMLLDERLMSPSRHSLVLIDTSELPASRFSLAIREKTGRLREPDETEYHYIRKQEKGTHPFVYVKYHKENNPM